jgi:glycosyltransferase involved in cell wall biosynthesis
MTERCLVISACNLTEGGPLTILREFVAAASELLPCEWKIIVFVRDRGLLDAQRPVYIELPSAERGWLRRMYTEWHAFKAYARELNPDLWLSLQDVTPAVGKVRQAVYCHNPMPFYRMRLRDMWLQPVLIVFRVCFAFIYRVHIKRNSAVIVQQSWLREKFSRWVGASTRIIVAHPTVAMSAGPTTTPRSRDGGGARFLYPTLPRVFKNVELICRAASYLERSAAWRSEIVLTLDGTETRYARWLWRHFGHLKTVRFAGRHTAQQMRELYRTSDCLIFPSLLETWGLPITEAKQWSLPMLVANLPYAHETLGRYQRVGFIDVADPLALARRMLQFQNGDCDFEGSWPEEPAQPYARNWQELLALLIAELEPAAAGGGVAA